MSQCSRCGAGLAPDAVRCTYCGQATAFGVERARWQEQAAEQARMGAMSAWYHARAEHARTAVGAGRTSLVLGILSALLFCLPLGVLPLVFGLRSRKLARQAAMDVPASAWVGLILGLATLLGFTALWTAAIISVHEDTLANEDRVKQLESLVAAHAGDRVLGHDTACQLAELKVRKDGYRNDHDAPKSFDCGGKLTTRDEHAMLEDFRFNLGPDFTAAVCFKYGVRWYVDEVKDGPTCALGETADAGVAPQPETKPAPKPSPKPAPTPHPSAKVR